MKRLSSRSKSPQKVRVSVPATTANLGPGFDSLGLALDVFNDFTVTVIGRGNDRTVGQGTCESIRSDTNIFHEAMDRVYRMAHKRRPAVELGIQGRVPIGRGLGSSATAVVGGALAANALLGKRFSPEQMLGTLNELEGHPDNIAPALFGSLTACVVVESGILVHAYRPHPDWRVTVLIPSYELPTREARRAIPKRIPHSDAVYNLTRVPFVIDALVEGDPEIMERVMGDRLHEPYRMKFIKGFEAIRRAGLRAGASGVFLSGAGPTIAAFCQGEMNAEKVRKAMKRAASFDPDRLALTLKPCLKGARVRVLR